MADRKEIKIAIVLDHPSFDRAKTAITGLAASANKALSNMSNLSGGLLGGATKGQSYHNSGRGSQSKMSGGNANQTVGISQAMIRSIQDQKAMMDSLSNAAISSLKDMESVVRQSVRSQSGMFSDLKREIDGVVNSYSRMSNGPRGWTSVSGGQMGLGAPVTSGGGSGGGPTVGNNIISRSAAEPMGDWIRGVGRTALGMGAAGVGIGAMVANQTADVAMQLPYYQGEMQARYGNYMGTRAKQMNSMTGAGFAFNQALRDDQKDYQAGRQKEGEELDRRIQAHQLPKNASLEQRAAFEKEGINILVDQMKYYSKERGGNTTVGGIPMGEMNAAKIGNYLSAIDPSAILRGDASSLANVPKMLMNREQLDAASIQRQQQAAENRLLSDPENYSRGQEFVDDNLRRIGNQRAGRVGGQYKTKDGKLRNRALDLEADLHARGWSMEARTAGIEAMVPFGGEKLSTRHGQTVMTATQGSHITQAGKIMGVAAQMGMDPVEAIKLLSGTGLDRQVQSQLGGMVADLGLSSGTNIDFRTLMGHIATGIDTSANGAIQMQQMRTMGKGFSALSNQTFGGGLDNLQKAQNYANALTAFGGNVDAAHFIANNPNALPMILQSAQKGQIPDVLASMGVTDVKAIQQFGDATMASRGRLLGATENGQNSPMRSLYREMLAGGYEGNYGKYLKDKNLHGDDLQSFLKNATAMELANNPQVKDEEQALGVVKNIIGREMPKELQKGELTDYIGKQEREIAKAQAAKMKEDAGVTGAFTKKDFDDVGKAGQVFRSMVGISPTDAQHFAAQMKQFGTAVEVVTGQLRQLGTVLKTKPK